MDVVHQNTSVTHALTGSMPMSRAVKGWSSLLVSPIGVTVVVASCAPTGVGEGNEPRRFEELSFDEETLLCEHLLTNGSPGATISCASYEERWVLAAPTLDNLALCVTSFFEGVQELEHCRRATVGAYLACDDAFSATGCTPDPATCGGWVYCELPTYEHATPTY